MVRVVQCWDDGVFNDIRLVELLRKYNAKATFNLCPSFHGEQQIIPKWADKGYDRWSFRGYIAGRLGKNELHKIYSGFHVASHCMNHEGAGLVPDSQFIQSALDARHFLEDLFQCSCPGFAWPGGRYTSSTAQALHENDFLYGRTVEKSISSASCENPLILKPSCHFQDWEFYKKFEQSKKEGGVFYFWGHSFEMMNSEDLWKQFEMKLQYLDADPDVVWCNVDEIDWTATMV